MPHIRTRNWDIEITVREFDDPERQPEITIVTTRCYYTQADQEALDALKAHLATLPGHVTLRDVMRSAAWEEFKAHSSAAQSSSVARSCGNLTRAGFQTLAEIRGTNRELISYGRNLGKRTAQLLGDLFDLP